jgi:methionyl-tRNA formyltransferase
MATSTPIVFFGTEAFSAPSLAALIAANYAITAVVTKPDSRRGRGRTAVAPRVKHIAQAHTPAIAVIQPGSGPELQKRLGQFKARLGVLVAYGRIIPQGVIDMFELGIVNIHPSRLPLYRGPAPIEAAILDGLNSTAISVMQLSAMMDAGPVYAQQTVELPQGITKPEAYRLLAQQGAQTLIETLPRIIDGSLQPTEQDAKAATYTSLIHKSDGRINWRQPAAQIERQVRAYLGWPGSSTTLFNKDVAITKAHVTDQHGDAGNVFYNKQTLGVYCQDQALILDELKPTGKPSMSGADFARGYAASA